MPITKRELGSSSSGTSGSNSRYGGPPRPTKKKRLPSKFADQVVQLESDIACGRFNLETVNKLLLLYSQAVEYYNSLTDEKYQYYEGKIQTLLVRPDILLVMSQKNKEVSARDVISQEQRLQLREHEKKLRSDRFKNNTAVVEEM